ncbi:MAG: serine hydrolase, partial [Deltaproteobacteria bacterium]|nr:serine hydrolase [Deltaproteobacteria bacterium]
RDLDKIRMYLGGHGFIARNGYQVYAWGAYDIRADIASAAKPWYSFFLLKAVDQGKLGGLDTKAVTFEPRLKMLNADLGFKDRQITFRHLANQTSCYGVRDQPGSAFDYNDYQTALLWDILFTKVYRASPENIDQTVFHPLLTDILHFQDSPTMVVYGTSNRLGRIAVSPRDFARFGLLFGRGGMWNGTRVLSPQLARMAVSDPLPAQLPRTNGLAAEMIPGQRSIGAGSNMRDHHGAYSWMWWVNHHDRNGYRYWPDAPPDVFAALGHKNGKRGVAVMPSQDIVISWNSPWLQDQTPFDGHGTPHPLNVVFKLLARAKKTSTTQ